MLTPMRIGLRHHRLDLSQRHERKKSKEEKEQHGKEAEGAEKCKDVDDGGRIISPTGWKKISGKSGIRDDEPLKPHADVDEDGYDPDERRVFTNLPKPKKLRTDDVAGNHNPIRPPVISESPIDECEALVGVGSIPSDEELHGVGVTDHAAGGESDLAHVVDVLLCYQVVQAIDRPQRQKKRKNHSEP